MGSLWTIALSCLALFCSCVAISYSFAARMYAEDAARHAADAADTADVAVRTRGTERDPKYLRRVVSGDEVSSPWTPPCG